jgi:hypothetical protein
MTLDACDGELENRWGRLDKDWKDEFSGRGSAPIVSRTTRLNGVLNMPCCMFGADGPVHSRPIDSATQSMSAFSLLFNVCKHCIHVMCATSKFTWRGHLLQIIWGYKF